MNKAQAEQYMYLHEALMVHGITQDEVDVLLRCERTLQRWAERECGDGSGWAIERDEETGKPFNVYYGEGTPARYAIADRESGALKRAARICAAHGVQAYHQQDCRGCMLYIVRPGDIPEGEKVGGYYNRGVAVCI